MLRKIKFKFFYILAGIYIVLGLYSLFLNELPPVVVAHAGVLAFLLTAYDFSLTGYRIEKERRNKILMVTMYVISVFLIVLAVISVYILIRYWSSLNKKSLEFSIGLLSDYSTLAALGIVFLTKAMLLRSKSGRNLR